MSPLFLGNVISSLILLKRHHILSISHSSVPFPYSPGGVLSPGTRAAPPLSPEEAPPLCPWEATVAPIPRRHCPPFPQRGVITGRRAVPPPSQGEALSLRHRESLRPAFPKRGHFPPLNPQEVCCPQLHHRPPATHTIVPAVPSLLPCTHCQP